MTPANTTATAPATGTSGPAGTAATGSTRSSGHKPGNAHGTNSGHKASGSHNATNPAARHHRRPVSKTTHAISTPPPTPAPGECAVGAAGCVTPSGKATVSGSSNLEANLVALMVHNQPYLSHVHLACPASRRYPITCRLTAVDSSRGKPTQDAGTLTVVGVDTATRTYAYQLLYQPIR
ncbi:MAG: hypothetical protein ACYDHH_23745 [Solirubrobacteraceae bacterium]